MRRKNGGGTIERPTRSAVEVRASPPRCVGVTSNQREMQHVIRDERVLITGGAGTIGSNLADLLVKNDAGEIVILDNFVRGRRDNLAWAEANGNVTVVEGDICD